MKNPLPWHGIRLGLPQRGPGASLLGLAFDGHRLEGVALRRTNGAVEVHKTFVATLSLDPLTDASELVGRELRKHLEAAGIRERRCTVCVPLSWVLTLAVKLPNLPEADLQSFLQIEAERGFPYGPDALVVAPSRYRTPNGETYATLVAIPRDHLGRLEAALRAAQLRPVSFSLGITALQRAQAESTGGVLALVPGEHNVSLQISSGGGVAVLRTIEGAFELEGGETRFQPDHVAREVRITLGQLPPEVAEPMRDSVHRLRVFGQNDAADELAEQLGPRVEALGLQVEQVKTYAPQQFGVQLPPQTPVSPALSLAVWHLTGQPAALEYLPPKISAWKQITTRYSSRKLVWAGAAAGAVALVVAAAFLVQQWQIVRWRARWNSLKPRVTELESLQRQIKLYRPWFDDSFRCLSILRRLTEAFPEDGTLSAKTVGIQQSVSITCSGTARDNQTLLKALDQLRKSQAFSSVQVEQIRGKAPMQFTFNLRWGEGHNP